MRALASGRFEISITVDDPESNVRVVANRRGSKKRIVWRNLPVNEDGEFVFRTKRNLEGWRLRLVVDGKTEVRFRVPRT